jgi:hypothetical protein
MIRFPVAKALPSGTGAALLSPMKKSNSHHLADEKTPRQILKKFQKKPEFFSLTR